MNPQIRNGKAMIMGMPKMVNNTMKAANGRLCFLCVLNMRCSEGVSEDDMNYTLLGKTWYTSNENLETIP
jgi:hypothetical protein